MRYYDYLNPSANFMGPGCVKDLGHRCELLNMKKPLIVTDDFLASVENGPVAQSLASLKEKGIEAGKDRAEKAVALIKERATFPQELWNLSWFLFKAPEEYEEKGVAKFWKGENPARIAALKEVIAGIDDFTKENDERIVHDWIVAREYPMGQVMNSLRLTLVGAGSGPSIFDICEIIGKEETLRRIDTALDKLGRQAIG